MTRWLLLAASWLCACQRSQAPEPAKAQGSAVASSAPTSVPPVAASTSPTSRIVFAFDQDPAGAAPSQLVFGRTGKGNAGRWVVQADATAKGAPHVLAQLDADATSFRFPVAVTAQPQPANVRVQVSCKMISGRVDQACGLVLRYRDENNYLITRANALENNVRLYTVKDGKRDEIASHDGKVAANAWHNCRFEARGEELRVWWDDKLVLEKRDQTFLDAGSVGVWTKADSVTYFDDLIVEPL